MAQQVPAPLQPATPQATTPQTATAAHTVSEGVAQRWRFGLPGLMVVILGLALGLGEYKARTRELPTDSLVSAISAQPALRAAHVTVSFWLVMGMLTHAWRLSRLRAGLATPESRFGNTLAIVFRLSLAAVIVAYHLWEHFQGADYARRYSTALFIAPRAAEDYNRVTYSGALMLVACLSRQTRGLWRRWAVPEVLLIVWTLAIPAAAIGLFDRLVESVQWQAGRAIPQILGGRVWVALHALFFVPASMAAIYLLARGNNSQGRTRIYFGVLVASLALQAFGMAQLARLAPELWRATTTKDSRLAEFTIAGLPCAIMLSTLVAYALSIRLRRADDADTAAAEQPPLAASWHERSLVWVLLGAVLWLEFWYGWLWYSRFHNFPFWSLAALGYLVTSESVIPHLMAAMMACVAGLARSPAAMGTHVVEVARGRFLWTWLAVNAVSLLAIYSVGLLAFHSRMVGPT